tara:strand:+ start:48 stop:506 length:459 start_codon:yes stop_codon:yes gene_type:complete
MEISKKNNKIFDKYIDDIKKKKNTFVRKLNDIKKLNLADINSDIDNIDNKNLHDSIKYDKINSNYFSPIEILENYTEEQQGKTLHYILLIISIILIWLCGQYGLFLIFEIILALFYPYIFIPLKIILCHKSMIRNCKFIYTIFDHKINNNLN